MNRRSVWLIVLFAVTAMGADWPQWRGPNRDGKSTETGLLKEWPEGGPKLVWQVKDIGDGYSTPSVVGDRLYLISNRGIEDEFVQALSAADGKQIWQQHIGKVGTNTGPQYPGSRSTPTVDGDLLYALGSDGDLACLEISTGAVRWTKSLRNDFGGKPGAWAYSESPLIDGEVLIIAPGGADATVVALAKKTGDLVWKCPLPEADDAAYSSAIVIEVGGVKQYVEFLSKGLVGIDAATGKSLWRYEKTAQGSAANIPTPVAADNYVYSAGGRTGGGLVQLSLNDGTFTAEQLYFAQKLPNSIGGSIKIDDYLYGTSSGSLLCVDYVSGEIKWQGKSVAPGALCYAEGRLYLHGEKGDVALIEATPEEFREKGKFTPVDQPDRGRSNAWCYPVIANGKLYLRDVGTVWCYDVKE